MGPLFSEVKPGRVIVDTSVISYLLKSQLLSQESRAFSGEISTAHEALDSALFDSP